GADRHAWHHAENAAGAGAWLAYGAAAALFGRTGRGPCDPRWPLRDLALKAQTAALASASPSTTTVKACARSCVASGHNCCAMPVTSPIRLEPPTSTT